MEEKIMNRILRIPGIKLCNDRKYKLFCGWCGSTNIKLEEVLRNNYGNIQYQLYCQDNCNVNGGRNSVGSVPKIKEFAARDCHNDIDVYYKMLFYVYRYLGIDQYLIPYYKSLQIENELRMNFDIKQINDIKELGFKRDSSYYYLCSIKDIKYIIKVEADGKVHCIEADKYNANDNINEWIFKGEINIL